MTGTLGPTAVKPSGEPPGKEMLGLGKDSFPGSRVSPPRGSTLCKGLPRLSAADPEAGGSMLPLGPGFCLTAPQWCGLTTLYLKPDGTTQGSGGFDVGS